MATKVHALEIEGVRHDAPIPMGAKVGRMVYSSGIMGRDPRDNSLPPEPERQAELMFANIRSFLELAGATTDDIGHFLVFLTDNRYREHLNREWLKMFPDEHNRPARHTLLFDLPREMLMQCEIVAVLD